MDGAVKITDITVTKKGRYALFCDESFAFSLDEESYLKSRVRIGDELTQADLQALREQSDYFSAKNKALDYLSYREHSEKELRDKLLRRFDEHTSAQAIGRLKELGLVDDAAFAKKYAQELIERRRLSKRAAAAKLYEKGIPKELSNEALAAYEDDERSAIRAVVERKYRAKLRDADKRKNVFAALARLGFKTADIREVLSAYAGADDGEAPAFEDMTE